MIIDRVRERERETMRRKYCKSNGLMDFVHLQIIFGVFAKNGVHKWPTNKYDDDDDDDGDHKLK